MANVAQRVREEKEIHPDRFCAQRACLWRTRPVQGPTPCRNHPVRCEGCGADRAVRYRVTVRGALVAPRHVHWCGSCADFALGADGAFVEVAR